MDLHAPETVAAGCEDHVTADTWAVLTAVHPSMLLIGLDAAIQTILSQVRSHLRSPVSWWTPGAGPEPLPITGALIIPEIGTLSLDQQQRLLDWIEAKGRDVQVVSLSERPVFPLVETGAFLPALYYRLNIVCLHVAAMPYQS
jgi:hypothetical protein